MVLQLQPQCFDAVKCRNGNPKVMNRKGRATSRATHCRSTMDGGYTRMGFGAGGQYAPLPLWLAFYLYVFPSVRTDQKKLFFHLHRPAQQKRKSLLSALLLRLHTAQQPYTSWVAFTEKKGRSGSQRESPGSPTQPPSEARPEGVGGGGGGEGCSSLWA